MMYSFNMVLLGEINNKQCFTKMLMVQLNIQRLWDTWLCFTRIFENTEVQALTGTYGSKYSGMDEIYFAEDSL